MPTHAFLCKLPHADYPLLREWQRFIQDLLNEQGLAAEPGRIAIAQDGGGGYAYLHLQNPLAVPADVYDQWLQATRGRFDNAALLRLCLMQEITASSHSPQAAYHYVVEMRPEPSWAIELQQWYTREHLPGLAAVHGCTRARRWWTPDQPQSSLASYDVCSPDLLKSEAWLAVRHTTWSARVRPHFRDTLRTMLVLPADGDADAGP